MNPNRLTVDQQEIVAALKYFGTIPLTGSVLGSGNGITFEFVDFGEALTILGRRGLFAQGPLGILHSRIVGGVLTEYRSYRRKEPHSLHVVIGKGERVFADLDRFNPYQNPVALVKHALLELMPHLWRVAFNRGSASGAD